jgi:uncharacterized protein
MIWKKVLMSAAFLAVLFAGGSCTTTSDTDVREEKNFEEWFASQRLQSEKISEDLKDLRAQANGAKIQKPFLWKLEKGEKSAWLLGTIHLGVSLDSVPLKVSTVLESAPKVIVESDLDDKTNDLPQAIQGKDELRDSRPLSQRINAKAWRKLSSDLLFLKRETLEGLDAEAAHTLYTFLRVQLLFPDRICMDCEIQRRIAKPKQAYLERAIDIEPEALVGKTKNKKPMTDKELEKYLLKEADKDVRKHVEQIYTLILAYKKGDLPAIEQLVIDEEDFNYEKMVKNRNVKWMKKLNSLLETPGAVVAVGVGHMTGQSSLIKLLAENGYAVKRWDPAQTY